MAVTCVAAVPSNSLKYLRGLDQIADATEAAPSRAITPSIRAACMAAAFRTGLRFGLTSEPQYCRVMMPTRSVRKALPVPVVTELTKSPAAALIPGIAATEDPRTAPRMG